MDMPDADLDQDAWQASLMRVAKLICDRGEYLCIILKVRASGVKLRLFNDLKLDGEMLLEAGIGQTLRVSFLHADASGVTFTCEEAIDVAQFVAEPSVSRKRPVRVCLRHPASVVFRKREFSAEIVNLSCRGICIETSASFYVGERTRLSARLLPDFDATVRWKIGNRCGLEFDNALSLAVFADRTSAIQILAHANAQAVGDNDEVQEYTF
ncbi:PilZ domain-containing protein [Novosphingobium sp. AP12]|uniref:PilZ domain-containing protein n=1 Tax=Novosphingobium sp. AP12 TaxID=1144305 RepID=UPI000272198A|nr:PilZ domain-containing protein [Novosphingobium sp. AP12]EJL33749.1 PilZ domain-containing protein [Novosphingobium sp. AP12]